MRTLLTDYMSTPGTPLDIRKRVVLLNWMQEFCASNGLKRDTFHSAAILVDVYMSKVKLIEMNKYQLLGTTALQIAMKCEEVEFLPMNYFAHSTAGACSVDEIREFEKEMLKTLSWRTQFSNLSSWFNLISKEWDIFIQENQNLQNIFHVFRKDKQLGNILFQNLFLILDVMVLDYNHLKFNEKKICLALSYLFLGYTYQSFTLDNILHGLCNIQPNENFYGFNTVFNYFIKLRFNLELDMLRDEIEYSCFFFDIIYEYSPSPLINRAETEEERLQYQTLNGKIIESIKKVWCRRSQMLNENNSQCP